MGYVARLVHGSKELSLNDSTYSLWTDFIPPAPARAVQMSAGTFRNKSGGKRMGSKALDRTWYFGVRILGASNADINNAAYRLQSFLDLVEDESNTLYFEYSPNNDVTYRPLYGQGFYRYPLKDGTVSIWDMYSVSDLSTKAMVCPVTLIVGPYAEGLEQRLGTASGYVVEDTVGAIDGRSRAVIVDKGITNLFTNPILGHSTYSNDYTVSNAALQMSKNTDKAFVAYGVNSVKLVNTDSVSRFFSTSINEASTASRTLSCYARLPDGSAISATQCALYHGAAKTTVYTAVPNGNGWYRLTSTFARTTGAIETGLQVEAGYTVYADGFQFEGVSNAHQLSCGDFLGNAWTGTAHDSTSTSTAGMLRFPFSTMIDLGEFTIEVALEMSHASTFGSRMYIYTASTATTFRAMFFDTDDKFYFGDGTTQISTAAQTFAAGDKFVFHFVASKAGGLKLYVNGVDSGSAGGYVPIATPGDYLYIGSDNATYWGDMKFKLFKTYRRAMTQAEVTARYNNLSPLITDNQYIEPIPYLWNKDGDGIVDNCDDSTRDNWAIANGIPGNTAAQTEIQLTSSVSLGTGNAMGLYLSNFTMDRYIPMSTFYGELQGSVDANSSNGEFERQSVTAATVSYTMAITTTPDLLEALSGKEFYAFCRVADAGATLKLKTYMRFGNDTPYDSDWETATSDSDFTIRRTKSVSIPDYRTMLMKYGYTMTFAANSGIYIAAGRSTSGAANVDIDFYQIFPRPITGMLHNSAVGTAGAQYSSKDHRWRAISSANLMTTELVQTQGDRLELEPNKVNALLSLIGWEEGAAAVTIAATLTYNSIVIIPRWELL